MKLFELPLVMEGLHQVRADSGYRRKWYIDRWAEIPKEWEEEFLAVERALGGITGKTLAECAVGRVGIHLLDPDIEMTEMAILHVYAGMVEGLLDCEEMMLFNDFFDGDENSRHQRMQERFVTDTYSI